MTGSGPIARALAASLRAAPALPRDAAGVALAKRYAALLDDAAPAAKYDKALRVLESAVEASEHDGAAEAFRTVANALAAHSTTSDLGPKFKEVLTALGMTLAGRKDKENSDGGTGPVPGADELAALRAERAGQR